MKSEIKTLNRLVQLALSANTLLPVSEQELLAAVRNLENAVLKLPYPLASLSAIKKNIKKAQDLLSLIIYNMEHPGFGRLFTDPLSFQARINAVYRQLDYFSDQYNPYQPVNTALLPLDDICRYACQLEEQMCRCRDGTHPFILLQPHFTALHKTKCLPYHRWQWWSAFCNAAAPLLEEKQIDLEAILTVLNFNTPEYIHWLVTQTRQHVRVQLSLAARIDFLSGEMLKYKCTFYNGLAFMPAQPALKQAMLTALKHEYKLLQLSPPTEMQQLPKQEEGSKFSTSLSVPQLAVFIRLLIDADIINENNRLALFKNIAGTVCTSKTRSMSPESLRVNFYTPNTAAKAIVKEYLINMINQLKNY